jgi:glutamate synthase domain-containing protein 3
LTNKKKGEDDIYIRNASGLNNIAVGVRESARIVVGSDVGDLIGALNDGDMIEVRGSAGKYAADGMTAGEVIVNGDADEGAGSAMCGGILVIKGNAKNRLGELLKGGTIVVGGNVGHHVASFMIAGTIVIGGNAGRELGDSMIGGAIYIKGSYDTLGKNLRQAELTEEDELFLRRLFSKYQLDLDTNAFKRITPFSSTLV